MPDGKNKLHDFDAEIFSVGTWNGDKYTEADLDDMVKNFDQLSDEIKPPVKLGHNDEQLQALDGQPALGWVSALRRVGDKLIASLKEVPEVLYKAIKAGRYKRVSSEIYWNLKRGESLHKRVLAAVALLGADIPAVSNLADLEKFLSAAIGKQSVDAHKVYSLGISDDFKITEKSKKKAKPKKDDKKMSEKLEAKIAKLESDLDALKTDKTDADKRAETAEADLKKFKAEAADKAKEGHKTELKAFCEEQVKAGKMIPAVRDAIVDDVDKLEYSEQHGFLITLPMLKQYTDSVEKVIEFDEKGKKKDKKKTEKEYDNASAELADRAKKYAAENKVSYEDAADSVLDSDHELANRYKMENV